MASLFWSEFCLIRIAFVRINYMRWIIKEVVQQVQDNSEKASTSYRSEAAAVAAGISELLNDPKPTYVGYNGLKLIDVLVFLEGSPC